MAENNSASAPAVAGARIAAIDVGSNTIRLVVAEVLPSGGYRVLDEERENTRLAAAHDEDRSARSEGGRRDGHRAAQLSLDRRLATA